LLRVINLDGRTVHTQKIVNTNELIYLNHLPAGMYICQLQRDGQINTVKVLKK
jgi:hypothetical protein